MKLNEFPPRLSKNIKKIFVGTADLPKHIGKKVMMVHSPSYPSLDGKEGIVLPDCKIHFGENYDGWNFSNWMLYFDDILILVEKEK